MNFFIRIHRQLLTSFFLLLFVWGCAPSDKQVAPSVLLRVAILGDAEPKPEPLFPNLSAAVDQINQLAIEKPIHFAIGVGDIAHKATEIQYENATPHLQRLTMPFYPIMGNEEHHGTVELFLKYANLWGNGKTSFDSPRYVVETPKVGFVFASPDYSREFHDTGVTWISEEIKRMQPRPVFLIVHGAQVGVYPENAEKGIANPTFASVIAHKNLVAVISGDLHMDMARVQHSKKMEHVHYLHIPALERTKIPDESNHTPMFRMLNIYTDGSVVVETYPVSDSLLPAAEFEYRFAIEPTIWSAVENTKASQE